MSPPVRPPGAWCLAELAGVAAAPGAGRGDGVPPAAAGGGAAGEFCDDVLGAAAAEVIRQEARVDVKAGQVATLAGTLSTLAVGAAAAVGALGARVPGWWAVVVTAPLVAAGVLWAAAVVVLLRRTIRPHLGGPARGSFVSPDHLEGLRGMSLADYRQALVARLDGLVLRRYHAVRRAVDLLVAGFVPLLASGIATAAALVMGVA